MAVESGLGYNSNGIAFLVSAGVMFEIMAAACSSPQTTELNAKARSATLMKWVNIGVGQAAVFILIAAMFDPNHRVPILTGGALAAVLMYVQYIHARNAGLANPGAPTETY